MGDAGAVKQGLLARMKEQESVPKDKFEKKVQFRDPVPTKEQEERRTAFGNRLVLNTLAVSSNSSKAIVKESNLPRKRHEPKEVKRLKRVEKQMRKEEKKEQKEKNRKKKKKTFHNMNELKADPLKEKKLANVRAKEQKENQMPEKKVTASTEVSQLN